MRKMFLFCTLFLATIFATSCLREETILREKPAPVVESDFVENGFFMKLDVQGSGIVGTRVTTVPGEPGESDVHSLYLLFFDAVGGEFVDYINASPQSADGAMEYEPLSMTTPIRVDFAGTNLKTDADYRILAVANIHAYVSLPAWLNSFSGTSFNQAQARLLDGSDVSYISSQELLMTSSITRRAGQEMVHINLLRALVRFDVEMDVNGYQLESVSVWNVPVLTALWNSDYNDFREHFEHFTTNNELGQGTVHKGVVYSFENSVTGSFQGDTFTTCLILGIRDVRPEGTGRVTYYRVNVNESGAQLLRRNHVYHVTVSAVRRAGENTERDAWTGIGTWLDINVRQWQDGGQGGVMFDGEDILAIGANRIDFDGDGGTENVTIFTFSPNPETTLQMVDTDLPTGIEATLDEATSTLIIKAYSTSVARSGFIELQFGTMRGVVQVVQSDQQNLYLDLSVGTTEMPLFPQGGASHSGNVTVTSSGSWTAVLYGEEFTFGYHGGLAGGARVTTVSGISGSTFSVSTIGSNAASESLYAFVIVSLDANPTINRVLVLRQDGNAFIELVDRMQANLLFRPDGKTICGNDYFDVLITASDDWQTSLSGPTAGRFSFENRYIEHSTGKQHYLRIRANAPLTTALDATATITGFLTIDPSIRTQIQLRQQAYTLSLSPTTFPAVPATGGKVHLTVTSSYPNWATAPANYVELEVGGIPTHPITVERVGNTNTLVVDFPLIPANVIGTSPTATVTARIPGTDVSASVTIQQGQRVLRDLYILTARSGHWGTWHATAGDVFTRSNLGRLRDEIAGTSNFGANGVVLSGSRTFSSQTGINALLPNDNVHIYLSNSTHLTAAQGAQVRAWLAGDARRVLIVTSEFPFETSVTGVRNLLGPEWTGHHEGSTLARGVTGNANTSLIHAYLFRDGPFSTGTDVSAQVSVRPLDAIGGTLSTWSPTFVPIIFHPGSTSRVGMGIDPVNRIVYIGEPEIFGRGVRTNTDWGNAANIQFVRNVAAWIINTTQRGEEFTRQFH